MLGLGDLGGVAVDVLGVGRLLRHRHHHAIPVALEDHAGPRVLGVLAELLARHEWSRNTAFSCSGE